MRNWLRSFLNQGTLHGCQEVQSTLTVSSSVCLVITAEKISQSTVRPCQPWANIINDSRTHARVFTPTCTCTVTLATRSISSSLLTSTTSSYLSFSSRSKGTPVVTTTPQVGRMMKSPPGLRRVYFRGSLRRWPTVFTTVTKVTLGVFSGRKAV